jgi:hypothetical protein
MSHRAPTTRVLNKPVMGGPPTEDVHKAVTSQCRKLLKRLRQTVPFPCDPVETTRLLLPPDWVKKPALADQAANLHLSMLWGHLVHVAIDDRADWVAALEGKRVWQRVFWMHLEDEFPVPDEVSHPYRLFEEHPHRNAIGNWWHRAWTLEQDLDAKLDAIAHVTKHVYSVPMLAAVWPDLMKFLKLQMVGRHIPIGAIRSTQRAARKVLSNEQLVSDCTSMLAAATLLEEREVNAWVSFKTA